MDTDIDHLLHKLETGTSIVQRVAIHELGHLEDPRAVGPLLKVLRTAGRGLQVEAARALGRIGRPAVLGLIQALHDDDPAVWALAAAACLTIGPGAAPALLDALHTEPERVQALVVSILGQLGEPRAAAAIGARLDHPSEELRTAAAVALVRLGAPAVLVLLPRLTAFDNPAARRASIEIIRQIGEEAIPPLNAVLYRGDALERQQAATLLVLIGEAAAPALLAALEDGGADLRHTAAAALGQMGYPGAVAALAARLRDQQIAPAVGRPVGEAAAAALRQIGTPEALAALRGGSS